jgi:NADPH:quinone reductase-like Zn-dependent oxidoreductase
MSISTMQAIRIKSLGVAALESAPIPQLRDDYILVKTRAVTINPADWNSIDYIATPGEIVGCDYSGVVVQVGALLQDQFRPGDRVAGLVHGCEYFSVTCVSPTSLMAYVMHQTMRMVLLPSSSLQKVTFK